MLTVLLHSASHLAFKNPMRKISFIPVFGDQETEAQQLNVTGLSSYCQKVSDLGPVIFYSKSISHASYLLKILHSVFHCSLSTEYTQCGKALF